MRNARARLCGLDYFGARYYDSGLGRFLTPDWSATPEATPYADLSNPQSLNLYSYVLNNPMTVKDPDGHCAICVLLLGGAAAGAVAAYVRDGIGTGDWSRPDGAKIWHGAVAGAIVAGSVLLGPEIATPLGISEATATAGTAALGGVAGGASERALNGEKVLDGKAMTVDAATAALGAAVDRGTEQIIAAPAVRELAKAADGVAISLGSPGAAPGSAPGVCKPKMQCGAGAPLGGPVANPKIAGGGGQ